MSLRVWLPLNGDLHNQGISNINITSGTPVYSSSGKIGNASLDFINSTRINIYCEKLANVSIFSICFWAKSIKDTNDSDWASPISFGAKKSGGSEVTSFRFGKSNAANVAGYPVGVYHNAENIISNSNKAFTTSDDWGKWVHICFTCDGTNIVCYKNGVKVAGDASGQGGLLTGNIYLRMTRSNWFLNDLRVYDHCLSAAEVREISKGLVLHYKLNDAVGFTDIIQNQNTYSVYNNYSSSGTTGTLTNLSETFYGNVVRREVMTPNDTSVNNFKTSLGSHGVYGHRQTFLANTKYVFWIYYRPVSHMDVRVGGTASNIAGWTEIPPVAVGGGWYRVGQYRNGTVTTDKTDNIFTSFYTPTAASGVPITIDWASPHLLQGTTEIPPYDYPSTIIQDSSGYGHNGEIINTVTFENNSPRYNTCTHISATNQKIKISNFPTSGFGNSYTFAWWAKISSVTPMHWGFSDGIRLNGMYTGRLWNTGDSSNNPLYTPGTTTQVTAPTVNVWHHWAMTGDGTTCKVYQDGELWATAKTYKAISGTTIYINGWNANTDYSSDNYSISDFRIYCTPLLDTDIKQLYNVGMKVDKSNNIHTFELNEQKNNLAFPAELSRINLTFSNGVGKYTQANCQVTLTEQGYHIYRPPNTMNSSNGGSNNMWGGLKLVNQSTDTVSPYNATRDNIWNLQTGHTYLWTFHVSGQTTNSPSLEITHNMGNGVSNGVTPTPTIISQRTIPTNFTGEQECFLIFTIPDAIIKTCNKDGAGYTNGSDYLSYRHLKFGFGYTNTGELGTDLYLTNFQIYDITSVIGKILKSGVLKYSAFIETDIVAKIRKGEEFLANQFIER